MFRQLTHYILLYYYNVLLCYYYIIITLPSRRYMWDVCKICDEIDNRGVPFIGPSVLMEYFTRCLRIKCIVLPRKIL